MTVRTASPSVIAIRCTQREIEFTKRIWLATLSLLIAALWWSAPVVAQTASPEIKAKERSDPASGDVVIINRKSKRKKKTDGRTEKQSARKAAKKAPDPYAPPIKLNPLPSTEKAKPKSVAKTKPRNVKPAETAKRPARRVPPKTEQKRDAAPSRQARRTPHTAPRATQEPPVLPPLPDRNSELAARSDRLRQYAPNRFDESERRDSYESRDTDDGRDAHRERAARRRAIQNRRLRRRRIARESQRYRNDWQRRQRRVYRQRPWRRCRRLAWRCQDGFERACYRWQRRCT